MASTGASDAASMRAVRALFFDVFGTTVDWRSTVTAALEREARRALDERQRLPAPAREKASTMGHDDWARFAAEWREAYYEFTRGYAKAADDGAAGRYKTIDQHHLDSLVDQLARWGLTGLWDEGAVHDMSLVWHRLDPWPDSVQGLRTLAAFGLQTSTLSNGSVQLLQDMAAHARLPWTHVVSSAMFESYKPNPKVYLGAARRLGLEPSECCMVAAHLNDLDAAHKLGFRTIYVERDREEAWPPARASACRAWVDIWVDVNEDGFLAAADKLRERRT